MNHTLIKQAARRLATDFIQQGYQPQGLYHYTDEQGQWIYSRMRLNHPEKSKLIRPFHQSGGHFQFGEPVFNGKKPLYQLPLLQKAEMVFWVEGEPKVDVLIKLGLTATTSGGATSHDRADLEPLRGKTIVIWPDADESGQKHAQAVQVLSKKLDCDVSLIDVEKLNLSMKGDVVDWLKCNPQATAEDVLALPLLPKEPKIEYGAILVKASELQIQPIDWLWPNWLAAGNFHLLGGIAGTGKTTLSLALASYISSGKPFPGGSQAPIGNVVIWTGEDDIADTLTPRLIAMGADLDRVHFVQCIRTEDGDQPFDPSADLPVLQEAIIKVGNVKLLIIDPIVSVVKGDSHKNAEMRKNLAPLIQMAEDMRFAMIGITHFSKGTYGREPIERITGSLAFGAVARVVLVASKSTNDGEENVRIFLRAKSNIGLDTGGFEYSLEPAMTENGIETSRVLWGKAIAGSTRKLLNDIESTSEDDGGIQGCMQFLTSILSYSPVSANEIQRDCEANGYSKSTMNRAKKRLGIEVKKIGIGKGSHWVWELPKILNPVKDTQPSSVRTFGAIENLQINKSSNYPTSGIVEGCV